MHSGDLHQAGPERNSVPKEEMEALDRRDILNAILYVVRTVAE
jgi:hypothetical protein